MKKTLVAVAAVCATCTAFAQSSVTLFGVVDMTLARGTGSIADKNQLTNSGYGSSRLGFRGTEDLGGGMAASFWLEAAVNTDDGSGAATNLNNQPSGGVAPALAGGGGLTFNRRSTLSLSGANWGELRLGRDYTPQFWNVTIYDPFNTNGVATNQALRSSLGGSVVARASNSVGYLLPSNLGGFFGQIQHYFGENTSNLPDDGTGTGVRVGYAAGPVDVAVAYSSTSYATGDITQANVGGQWNFGSFKLMGSYGRDRVAAAIRNTGKGGLIGVSVPVGASEFRASYATYKASAGLQPTSDKWSVGYIYNMSKRTALYATYSHVNNGGGATQALNGALTAANQSSNGYDLGVRHSF